MTEEQLQQIIEKGEGLKVEFKEAKDSVPKAMYESVVSFSNTDGGTILLGVDDDGNITGYKSFRFFNRLFFRNIKSPAQIIIHKCD